MKTGQPKTPSQSGEAYSPLAKLHGSRSRRTPPPGLRWGVVALDLQRVFVDPASPAFLPLWEGAKGGLERVLNAARRKDTPIYWTQHVHPPHDRGGSLGHLFGRVLRREDPLAETMSYVGSPLLTKARNSAFIGTDLHHRLSSSGVTGLLICGVRTPLCVVATAAHAAGLGYVPAVVADATAAKSFEVHLAALQTLSAGLSYVVDSDEAQELLQDPPPEDQQAPPKPPRHLSCGPQGSPGIASGVSPKVVDVLVVGGGPAGIAAGLQASRDGHRTLLVSKEPLGGILNAAGPLAHTAGLADGAQGAEVAARLAATLNNAPLERWCGEVRRLCPAPTPSFLTSGKLPQKQAPPGEAAQSSAPPFADQNAGLNDPPAHWAVVGLHKRPTQPPPTAKNEPTPPLGGHTTTSKREIWARAVVMATGTIPRLYSPSGWEALERAGRAHRDIRTLPKNIEGLRVVVVGGGDAAWDTALTLESRGARPLLIHRSTEISAADPLEARRREKGIELLSPRTVVALGLVRNSDPPLETENTGPPSSEEPMKEIRLVHEASKTTPDTIECSRKPETLSAHHVVACVGRSPFDTLFQNYGPFIHGNEGVLEGERGIFLAGDLVAGRQRYLLRALGSGQSAAIAAGRHVKRWNAILESEAKRGERKERIMDTPPASQTESHENPVLNLAMEPPALLSTPPTPRPPFEIVHTTGRDDLAVVFVARFPHGNVCEMVDAVDPRYSKKDKWILNLSTQFGCPVGCPYCDAGGGYRGDVSAEEMLAMAHHLVARNEEGLAQRCKKLKVHFSRMGEPALNDAVLEVLPRLREWLSGPDVWVCIATTAPRRRGRWFRELTQLKNELFPERFQLQLSLNSTDEAARRRLVPMDHLSLGELASLGESFYTSGDRKIGLNFALARNIPFQAETIKNWFDPSVFCVKLTPINPTERGKKNGVETVLRSEREEAVTDSIRKLRGWGYDVLLSVGDAGEDEIGSNCGQAVRFLAQHRRESD